MDRRQNRYSVVRAYYLERERSENRRYSYWSGDTCTVVGSSDTSGGQYGGLRFEARGTRAVRLTLELRRSENIRTVYVLAYSPEGEMARWAWSVDQAPSVPGRQEVVFTGQQPAGPFQATGGAAATIAEVHVAITVAPASFASWIRS